MALADPRTVAATQKNRITINRVDTWVVVQVLTDEDKPVRDERVLLVLPDGTKREEDTNNNGIVRFVSLRLPPGEPVYVILPDVLEAWTDDVPEFELKGDQKTPLTAATGANDPRGGLARFRSYTKDLLDHLPRYLDFPPEKAPPQYRHRDRTKYLVRTEKDNVPEHKARVTLKIDRLTDDEKFEHITQVFAANGAWYTSGTLNYDPNKHRWFAGGGAVCNQLANFFLGYWYNHNNAYTAGATSTKMLKQMENDSATDHSSRIYPYRGFRDTLDDPLPVPMMPEDPTQPVPSGSWSEALYRDGARGTFVYTRIRHADIVNNGGVYSFAHDWQNQLAKYNVYSLGSNATGPFWYDHHGGFLINRPQQGLQTFAADGSKNAAGVYSHTPIVVKGLSSLHHMAQHNKLHLIVWPLQPLRAGGYAPSAGGTGEYLTDHEFGVLNDRRQTPQSTIDPEFRQSLARFIAWTGARNGTAPGLPDAVAPAPPAQPPAEPK